MADYSGYFLINIGSYEKDAQVKKFWQNENKLRKTCASFRSSHRNLQFVTLISVPRCSGVKIQENLKFDKMIK